MPLSSLIKPIIVALVSICSAVNVLAANQSIILQSTTSTANSGLYDYLLPIFEKKTGIRVNVVAVGTGQALKNAENGDGDVVLVHAKNDEENFVANGFGVRRFDVMYNDFVIVGPKLDPAKIRDSKSSNEALQKIREAEALFASRGDESGTYKKEMELWNKSGFDPGTASGKWYRETGSGMGATLNIAAGMGAYTLTDRGTWIAFKNKQDLEIQYEGDQNLQNQYGIILVNPDRHAHVKRESAQIFIDWILSEEGQARIAEFKIEGQQLFFPNGRIAGD